VAAALGTYAAIAGSGCSSTSAPGAVSDASVDSSVDSAGPGADAGDDAPCFGCNLPDGHSCPPGSSLDCYVNTSCPKGGATKISGTVYDPLGRNPLPNIMVYVPKQSGKLPPIVTGTSSCSPCATSIGDNDYVAFTFTDNAGHFILSGVPTGKNVPLVVQSGKWRRAITVASVADCAVTQLPNTGAAQARLPRNRIEGDMPQMALLTGGCDNMACFLYRVGVDVREFGAPGAGQRVDVYQGLGATGKGAALSNGVAGDCTTAACPLWSSKQALEAYDAVFMGCECDEHNETKPAAGLLAMHDWLGEGGRVFATHSQATWFKNGSADLQSIASWTNGPASGAAGPFTINDSFFGGMSLKTWLTNVGAADASGVVALAAADVSTSVTSVSPATLAWMNDSSTAPDGGSAQMGNVKMFTAGTPVTPADSGPVSYCGSINFTDIHPGGGQAFPDATSDGSPAPASVPAACDNSPLSAGEKALEYLLFDQAACVLASPIIPPPPPRPDGG
jgi:hypothetical protein